MAYFAVIWFSIGMGSEEWMKIGDLREWGQAECEPLYHTSGSKDKSSICTEYNDKNRLQYFWKKIHAKDGNKFCDPETVVSQVDRECGRNKAYRDWPISEYGDDFVNNNQTHPCWTNCNKYMTSIPEERLQKAQKNLIVGYALLLFLPLIQLIVLPFPYLRKIVVFVVWFWLATPDEDYWLGRRTEKFQFPTDAFFTFKSIMLGLYITHIVSTFNCWFFISDTCPIMQTGYIVELSSPIFIFLRWMLRPHPYDYVTCFNVQFNSLFCFFCATFMFITIVMITELGGLGGHCFKPSWCDIQVYFILVWYFLALMGFLVYNFKEEYKPLILENHSKRDIMEIVEQKWQGQKDIIFPLIDEREHIWNEIWTMCWNMEEVFWNPETRNEQYCDLLLAGYEGSESPALFYAFPSYKLCCIPAVNDYLAMIQRTESSKISLISVAQVKGDINWNVYELERKLPKSRRSFRKHGRAALWTGGVRDSLRVPPRPQKASNRPSWWRPPMEVGSLMKITGAQKYNGKLVRVIEELNSNKSRVRFENNPSRIIRIESKCLEEVTSSRSRQPRRCDQLMAGVDEPLNDQRLMAGYDNLAIDINPFFAHQIPIPVQAKKQCTILEVLEDSDWTATPSEVARRCGLSIDVVMEQFDSLGFNTSLMTAWNRLNSGFIEMQTTLFEKMMVLTLESEENGIQF